MLKDRSSTDQQSLGEMRSTTASTRVRKVDRKIDSQEADYRSEQFMGNENELDLLSWTLGYAIKRAQMRSYEVLFSIIGPNALTPGRMTALSLIGLQPGVKQSSIAEQLKISRAGAAKLIDVLEALGLVERCATEGDRRSYALQLTLDGNQELQKLHRQIDQYEKAISSTLAVGEREQLMGLLEKVAAAGPVVAQEGDVTTRD